MRRLRGATRDFIAKAGDLRALPRSLHTPSRGRREGRAGAFDAGSARSASRSTRRPRGRAPHSAALVSTSIARMDVTRHPGGMDGGDRGSPEDVTYVPPRSPSRRLRPAATYRRGREPRRDATPRSGPPRGRTVEVYRNLHRGRWSVRRGSVALHTDAVHVEAATFKVPEAALSARAPERPRQ